MRVYANDYLVTVADYDGERLDTFRVQANNREHARLIVRYKRPWLQDFTLDVAPDYNA